LAQVPKPANTVFYTENATSADHVMAQSWMSLADAEVQVAYQRHRQKSNCTFADGHVETCKLARAYDPAQGVDLWNPSLAW
jgi:prepilin-type processing-associated H-X9-DG protein